MSDWQETFLGEQINLKRGYDLPGRNRCDGHIPIFSSSGISGFHNEKMVDGPGVVTGRYGTIGKVFFSSGEYWPLNTTLYVQDFKGNDARFIYYFLQQLDWGKYSDKSAVPGVNRNDVHQELVNLPSFAEQKVIAAILSSLDDKIDLLHRQNKTLESMAETLFRQWFVEDAQEDWEEVKVSDFVELNKTTIGKGYSHQMIEYLDTGSLTAGKIENLQSLNLSDSPSRAKRIVQHNDVLISTVRPDQKHYGIIKNPKDNLVASTGFCVLTAKGIDPHFIYLLLTNDEMTEYLHTIAEGSTSTYPSLKPSDIGAITFRMPSTEKLNSFSVIAKDSWGKINSNHIQIKILEKLRDRLLPKLMSGEVKVT